MKETTEAVLVRQRLTESLVKLGHVVKAEKQRDQRDRKPLVVGKPLGQLATPLGIGRVERESGFSEKKLGLNLGAFCCGIVEIGHEVFSLGTTIVVLFLRLLSEAVGAEHFEAAHRHATYGADSYAGKERCQLVKLLALPAVGGVIVTLGTLDLDAEEDSRNFGCCFFGPPVLCHDDRGISLLQDVATGVDKSSCDLVPSLALVEPTSQIGLHRIGSNVGAIFQRARKHHVAPVASPVLAVVGTLEQLAYRAISLVGRRVEHKGGQVFGRRDIAYEIEPDSPQVGLIIRLRRELSLVVEEFFSNGGIDPLGSCRGGGDRKSVV